MRVARELRICGDCLQIVANGPDGTDLSPTRLAEIEAGLARLGPNVVSSGEDFGFLRCGCDICEESSYGERYGASVLVEEEGKPERAPRRLVELIASHFDAMGRVAGGWRDYHETAIAALCKEHMPSGSGFDAGTQFLMDESRPDKLIFATSFHHMNEGGFYDGWTEHRVIVTPSFIGGFDLKVTGRDKRGIKDYIGETFHNALGAMVREDDMERPEYREPGA